MTNAPFDTNNAPFFIPERKLIDDPKYYGGMSAQHGYNYQVAYTCWRLTELLNPKSKIEAIRVECLQDIDIKFKSEDLWSEEYIQVKDVKDQWTLTKLAPILQRFLGLLKFLAPEQKNQIRFRLVVANGAFNEEVKRNLIKESPQQFILQFTEKTKYQDKTSLCATLGCPNCGTSKKSKKNLYGTCTKHDKIQDALEWLFQQSRITIEIRDAQLFSRSPRLSDDYGYSVLDAAINENHLSYCTSFELIALNNLREYVLIKEDQRHAVFSALRCEVHDANGGVGKKNFTKNRVLEILRPYIASSALGAKEGVVNINKVFLEKHKDLALSEDQEIARRESQGETINTYERPFRGKKTRWQDIAANRDLSRSCIKDLRKKINEKAKMGCTAGIIITGNNGEGKSALLMRTAVIYLNRGATVYQINDPQAFRQNGFDPLLRLVRILSTNQPILLLLEDIYEKDSWKELCQQLEYLYLSRNGAPILLLATASENTVPKTNATLGGFLESFPLGGVTQDEKDKIEIRFPKAKGVIEVGHPFLEAMLQVHDPKGFAEIINGWLYAIKERSKQGYDCLLFVCVPSCLGLKIPATLLTKLDFADCLGRPENHGLIGLLSEASAGVDVEPRIRRMDGPHPLFSQAFLDKEVGNDGITDRYNKLIEKVADDEQTERVFFLHLLRRTLRAGRTELVKDILKQHSALVARCREHGSVKELGQFWPEIYRGLGEQEKAARCSKAALDAKPLNSGEVAFLAKFLTDQNRGKAVKLLQTWIEQGNERDAVVWEKYLELLTHKPKNRPATTEEYGERRVVLHKTKEWLFKEKSLLAGVWIQYLQLANEYGTGLDRYKALGEIAKRLESWRAEYPSRSVLVLEKYLNVLDEWREAGAKNMLRRKLDRGAEKPELDKIITDWVQKPYTSDALSIIPRWIEFPHILPQALDFTARWGADQDWRTVLQEIFSLLGKPKSKAGDYKNPQTLWQTSVAVIQKRGTESDVEQLIAMSRTLLFPVIADEPAWWIMLLKLLQLMIAKGTATQRSLAQNMVQSLLVGKIPENQWQNLNQSLDADWKNPGVLVENYTIFHELGRALLYCSAEIINQKITTRYRNLCRNFSTRKIINLICANLFAKAGQIQEATDLYEGLLDRHQKWQDPYYHYARFQLNQSAFKPAEELSRKGLALNPGHTAIRLVLVKALEGRRKVEEAQKEKIIFSVFRAVEPYHTGEETLEWDV